MGQITKDFAERMIATADKGKFSSLTQHEQRQLAIAWLCLHGHMTWEGMPEEFKDRILEFKGHGAAHGESTKEK